MKSGGFEERFRGLFEDQVFLAKVFLKSHVYGRARVLGSLPARYGIVCFRLGQRWKKYSAGIQYFNWLEQYLLAQGVRHLEVCKALQKKRFRYRRARFFSAFLSGEQRV